MKTRITALVGNDYEARHQAYQTIKTSLEKEYEVLSFSSEDDTAIIETHLGSHDLFGTSKCIVLRDLLDTPGMLDAVVASEHHIILLEEKLLAATKKKLSRSGEIDVREFKAVTKKDNAIFVLTNHLLTRNPKNMWLVYRDLVEKGYTVHQMIGVLWWQIKSMLLVQKEPTSHGLKPFVAGKAQKAAQLYGADLERKATELLDLYHAGHADGMLENRLEEWVLGIGR